MASLPQLPAELLNRIASYLFSTDSYFYDSFEDDGFCNLRLSCRSIEVRTRYSLERVAFTRRIVTLHPHSLSRLRDLSNHPRFGECIKELIFMTADHPVFDVDVVSHHSYGDFPRVHAYAEYGVIELARHGTDGVYPNEGLTLRKRVQLGLRGCFEAVLARTPNLHKLKIAPNFMASYWLDSPSRQEQLDEQARLNQQSAVSGAAEGDDFDQDLLNGENEDYDNDVDDPGRIEFYVYPDYLLYLLMEAVQQRGIKLSSLRSMSPRSSGTRARTFVEIAPVLVGLQHLAISFKADAATQLTCMDGSALHDHQDGQPVAISLGYALQTLTGLRSLELAFDDPYWEDDRNTNIAKSLIGLANQPFRQLTSIEIFNATFANHDLYKFLQHHKLIRRLVMKMITLPSTEHWRPILTLMLEDMPLLEAAICMHLHGGPEFVDATLRDWQSCCDFDYFWREGVLDGLKVALDNFPNGNISR